MPDGMPFIKFYPSDWLSDPELRTVPIAARGFWIDLLCLMHQCPERGYLKKNTGEPYTVRELGRIAAIDAKTSRRLLDILATNGVICRDENGIYSCRRMRREHAKHLEAKEFGAQGGNPTLKGGVKGRVKGRVNLRIQNPEARSKKEEPPQPPADAGGGDALVFAALREEFGLNPCDAREQRRLDRLARRLAAKANGLPPDQALQRACRGYRAIFPTAAISPEAVLKHWDQAVKHMDGVKASEALAAEAEERKREVDAIEEKRRRECERDAAEARRRMEACSHPKAMRREDRNSDGVKLGETCACGRFLFDRSLREAEERDREMAQ